MTIMIEISIGQVFRVGEDLYTVRRISPCQFNNGDCNNPHHILLEGSTGRTVTVEVFHDCKVPKVNGMSFKPQPLSESARSLHSLR